MRHTEVSSLPFKCIHRSPGMFRTTCTILLVALGICHVPFVGAAIDAIFFISVAPEHHISLSECHISFWTLGDSTEMCREGCSAVGGARIGLNTFETNFSKRRGSVIYFLTLQCPHASVSVEPCAAIEYNLFLPHGSFFVLRPSGAPANLGRLIIGLPRAPPPEDRGDFKSGGPAWKKKLRTLTCPFSRSVPLTNNWVVAYFGWMVVIALAWVLKTSYSHAALKLARSI